MPALSATAAARARQVAGTVLLAALYAGAARLGLMMDAVSGFATLVWPPSGIALAALLLYGFRFWPGVALGAFAVNAYNGAPLAVAAGIAAGNTLEAVLGAYALRRVGFRASLDRVRDVLALLGLAAGFSTMISATTGVTSLFLGGLVPPGRFGETWRAWWLGDAMGDLVLAPLVLSWTAGPWRRPTLRRALEAAALAAATAIAVGIVFDVILGKEVTALRQRSTLFPVLVWAALRFEVSGAAAAMFAVSGLAIWGTALGLGPFVRDTLHESLTFLQAFMATTAMTVLLLGAAISESRRRQRAQQLLGELSTTLAGSLDQKTLLDGVERLAVPALADACEIELHGETNNGAAASAAPTGPPAPAAPVAPRAPDRRSVMAVPLVAQGRTLGTMTFVAASPRRAYNGEDLELARETAYRVAAALENARLYREAQEAIRARDDFMSIASHELRTPLSALTLALWNLQRFVQKGPLLQMDPRTAETMERAVRQTGRLAKLIDDLLDVSRITGRRLELERAETDLTEIVREVAARFADEAARAGQRMEVQAAGGVQGLWDALRLEQVVTNLLSNALKYGDGKPIEVTLEADADTARIAVRDHGIGIAPEDVERIFAPFERAVPLRHYGGLGLGLYVTRQIVEAHGGTIRVESAPGAGSTFTVELPRRSAKPPEARPAEPARESV